ncbi:hypothetical protein AAHE18_11G175600 [Arachis hypogaea]
MFCKTSSFPSREILLPKCSASNCPLQGQMLPLLNQLLLSALPNHNPKLPKSCILLKKKVSPLSYSLEARGRGWANMPKQYLPLLGQPIALYSFYTFSRMVEVKEIIVVCDPSYKDIFEDAKMNDKVELKFALPGKERQDSVYNGLQECAVYFSFFC